MVLLMTVMIPAVNSVMGQSRFNLGVDSAASAVVTARAIATKPFSYPENDYYGAAALFLPDGEVRLIYSRMAKPSETNFKRTNPKRRGPYADYPNALAVQMPSGIRAAGIVRSQGKIQLLAPPFAVRFDRHGTLQAALGPDSRGNCRRLVYYDGNYDGNISVSSRPGGYNAEQYDPESPDYNASTVFDTSKQKIKLAFDEIETVVGVVVFDSFALHDAGLKYDGDYINQAAADWILDPENGQVLLFNRYNGTVME